MKADAISVGAEDGRGLWLRWVLANSLAETVGLGASFGVGAALFPYLQAPGILIALATAGAAIFAGTLLEGTAVGTAQWLVLRHPFPNMKWLAWALATAAGAFVAWALGMLPGTLMSAGSGAEETAPTEPGAAVVYGLATLMGLVAGSILGTPQGLALRRHLRRAALWVPANALAWAAGMLLAFVAADFVFSAGIGTSAVLLSVVTLAVIGAVVGAIHGAALVWLVRSHRKPG